MEIGEGELPPARETLQLRHQLLTAGVEARDGTYDSKRHHVLLFDARGMALRLLSLRREIKSVSLFDTLPSDSYDQQQDENRQAVKKFALKVNNKVHGGPKTDDKSSKAKADRKVLDLSLTYALDIDAFVCVYTSVTSVEKEKSNIVKRQRSEVVFFEPATLNRLVTYPIPEVHTLSCSFFDVASSRLVLATGQESSNSDDEFAGLSGAPTHAIDILRITRRSMQMKTETSDNGAPGPSRRSTMLCIEKEKARAQHHTPLAIVTGPRELKRIYAVSSAGKHKEDDIESGRTVIVWYLEPAQIPRYVILHRVTLREQIISLELSPCGGWLLTGTRGGTLQAWCASEPPTSPNKALAIGDPTYKSVAESGGSCAIGTIKFSTASQIGDFYEASILTSDVDSGLVRHWVLSSESHNSSGKSNGSVKLLGQYSPQQSVAKVKKSSQLGVLGRHNTILLCVNIETRESTESMVIVIKDDIVHVLKVQARLLQIYATPNHDSVIAILKAALDTELCFISLHRSSTTRLLLNTRRHGIVEQKPLAMLPPSGSAQIAVVETKSVPTISDTIVLCGWTDGTVEIYLMSTSERIALLQDEHIKGRATAITCYVEGEHAYKSKPTALKRDINEFCVLAGIEDGSIFYWKLKLAIVGPHFSASKQQLLASTAKAIRAHGVHVVQMSTKLSNSSMPVVISVAADGCVKVWQLPKLKMVVYLMFENIPAAPSCIGLIRTDDNDEHALVVGFEHGSLSAWEVSNNAAEFNEIKISGAHERRVSSICSIEGALQPHFLSASFDMTIVVWAIVNSVVEEKRYFDVGAPVVDCCVVGGYVMVAFAHEVAALKLSGVVMPYNQDEQMAVENQHADSLRSEHDQEEIPIHANHNLKPIGALTLDHLSVSIPTVTSRTPSSLLAPVTIYHDDMIQPPNSAEIQTDLFDRWENEETAGEDTDNTISPAEGAIKDSKVNPIAKAKRMNAKVGVTKPARKAIIVYNSMGEKSVRWVQVEATSPMDIPHTSKIPANSARLSTSVKAPFSNAASLSCATDVEFSKDEQNNVDTDAQGWTTTNEANNHLEKTSRRKSKRQSKKSVVECIAATGGDMSWVSEPLVSHLKLSIGFRPYWSSDYCWCQPAMPLNVIEIEDEKDNGESSVKKCSKCRRSLHVLELASERYRPHFSVRAILDIIQAVYSKLAASAHGQLFKKVKGKEQLEDDEQTMSIFAALISVMKSRYGMQSVVQTKIKQLMVSMCHFMREVDAIAVFGEFLAMHARDGSTLEEQAPNELVALCVCCYTWLYSRQMVMAGNAIVSTMAKESPHDEFKPCDTSCGSKHWQFVPLSCALLCAQENLMYPLVNPGFLRNILLFTGDYAQDSRWLSSLEIEGGGVDGAGGPQSAYASLRQRWIEVHRFMRLIVGEWRQQNESFRVAERVLFLQLDGTGEADTQVLEKLRLILSCLVFYDHDRVGVMAIADFTNILRRLRYLWPNERMTEAEAAETMEVSITFENAVRASCARFADTERDGQLCYLDFWAMLYVVGMKTRSMIKFREIPSFCHDYKLEVAPQLQEIILSFMEQSCTVLLPKGLLLGKSSFDQKATKQHVRRIGGLHDGMVDLAKSLTTSMSANDLIASRYEVDDVSGGHSGLFVESSTLILHQNASTSAADRFQPVIGYSTTIKTLREHKAKLMQAHSKEPALLRASSLTFTGTSSQIQQQRTNAQHPNQSSLNGLVKTELPRDHTQTSQIGNLYVQFHDVTPRRLQVHSKTKKVEDSVNDTEAEILTNREYALREEPVDLPLIVQGNADLQVLETQHELALNPEDEGGEEGEEVTIEAQQFPFVIDQVEDNPSTELTVLLSARSIISTTTDQNETESSTLLLDSARGSPLTRRRSSTTVICVPPVDKEDRLSTSLIISSEAIIPLSNEQETKEREPLRKRSPLRDNRLRSASVATISLSGDMSCTQRQEKAGSLRVLTPNSESPSKAIVSEVETNLSETTESIVVNDSTLSAQQLITARKASQSSLRRSSTSKPPLINTEPLDQQEEIFSPINPESNAASARTDSGSNEGNHESETGSSENDDGEDSDPGEENGEEFDVNLDAVEHIAVEEANKTGIQLETAADKPTSGVRGVDNQPKQTYPVESHESTDAEDSGGVSETVSHTQPYIIENTALQAHTTIEMTQVKNETVAHEEIVGLPSNVISASEPQSQNKNVIDTLTTAKLSHLRAPDATSPRAPTKTNIDAPQTEEPTAQDGSRPNTAQTHAFRFSQQPNFRSNAHSFNNPFRFAQWSPRSNSDGESDKEESSVTSKEGQTPFISPVNDDEDDEEEDNVDDMELRLSETSRRRIHPPSRLKHQLSATRLSVPGCNVQDDDPNMIPLGTRPLSSSRPTSSRKYRLDDKARRALFGDGERLEAGLVLGADAEAMIQQKWVSIFHEAEIAMFSPVKQAIERKLEQQRLIEESQSQLRRKRQEEAEQDAMLMQLARGDEITTQEVLPIQARLQNLRHERMKRESCNQLHMELTFGECVRSECQDASDTQYYHFHYAEGNLVGSIITIALHISTGDADMYMSTDTRVPSSTDYTWKSTRSDGQLRETNDDEGYSSPLSGENASLRIVLYPQDLLKARSLASNCCLIDDDCKYQQDRLSFYISVVARTPKTIFSIAVMCSGQKTEPSRAMQAVDYFIDRFNSIAQSFATSSSSSSRSSAQVPATTRYTGETREQFVQRIKHYRGLDEEQDEMTDTPSCGLPAARKSTPSESEDTDVESFQHLLEALSNKTRNTLAGGNKRASFLLAGPSEEQRELVQDEEERLQAQLSSPQQIAANQIVPELTANKRYSFMKDKSRRRPRGRTPPNQRLSPLKHQPATGPSASLHVAKFAPRPVAYSLSKLDVPLAPLGASASMPILGAPKRGIATNSRK